MFDKEDSNQWLTVVFVASLWISTHAFAYAYQDAQNERDAKMKAEAVKEHCGVVIK